jgi:hypothetical protein
MKVLAVDQVPEAVEEAFKVFHPRGAKFDARCRDDERGHDSACRGCHIQRGRADKAIAYADSWQGTATRGLHSLTSELNLRTFGTHRSHLTTFMHTLTG